MAKTPVIQVRGNGLALLENKLATNGKLEVKDQLDLLEVRRQVLTQLWHLPIWQPLEKLSLGAIGNLFGNLFAEETQWFDAKGIFFNQQHDHGYNESSEWYGLIQAQINSEEEIIQEAQWAHFLYFCRRRGKNKKQFEANVINLSQAVKFHLQEPGHILWELEYALKKTLLVFGNPREKQQINQLLQSFQTEEELLRQFFPLDAKLI